jgi:hypothetical protein
MPPRLMPTILRQSGLSGQLNFINVVGCPPCNGLVVCLARSTGRRNRLSNAANRQPEYWFALGKVSGDASGCLTASAAAAHCYNRQPFKEASSRRNRGGIRTPRSSSKCAWRGSACPARAARAPPR